MNKYTIFCTQEQTEKAFKLGAPIDEHPFDAEIIKYNEKLFHNIICIDSRYYLLPTSEQMCEWLRREKDIIIQPCAVDIDDYLLKVLVREYDSYEECYTLSNKIYELVHYDTWEQAISDGIDFALNYLLKN